MLLLVACLAGAARAQTRDAGARIERVADGVYAIIHENATEEWPHGNTGIVVGPDDVLVIDAAYLPSRAKADIALIRSVTDKPVRWLVMSHWHFDHNNGNSAYLEAYPGLTIVSERDTRSWIDLNSTWWSRMAGRRLSEEERKALDDNVRRRKAELAELASLKVVAPNLVFDHELTLWLGRRRVELRAQGRANSPNDVTIYLPDDRVLFTGDVLVQDPLPYVGMSWPVPWVDVLHKLEAIPVTVLVPGHAPVMKDHASTRKVRELMEAATTRVDSLARTGLTLDQIQQTISLDDVRKSYPLWAGASESDWKYTVTTLVERAWRGVRGQG
jgi:cyclase